MKWLACVFVTLFASAIFSSPLFSLSASGVVVTEIRLGGSDTVVGEMNYKQFISIHNASGAAQNLSGWRVQYAKANYMGSCDANSWSAEEPLSDILPVGATKSIVYQLTDNAAGSVRIIDSNNVVQDVIGWGQAPCYEGERVATVPQNDKSLVRYVNCDATYNGVDTNNNRIDFAVSQELFSTPIAPDCTPTCGASQELVDGVCRDDVCQNLDGFQQVVPDVMLLYSNECRSIVPLSLSEILPNAVGADDGLEFIELFNGTGIDADLGMYLIEINAKPYSLAGVLKAGSYQSFTNESLGYSLLNTEAVVKLRLIDGTVIDEVTYKNPDEGFAWALIDIAWQYTNQPSAGTSNKSSQMIQVASENDDKKPCATNQIRSPETGRCRLAATTAGTLTPCRDGQYRSEETNRCRSVAQPTKTLVPCKEGYYRNEETNRCRSIATEVKALVPCREGQERNPETNRCRNSGQMATAMDYKVDAVQASNKEFAGWWIIGIIGVLALARIVWEWRNEIMSAVKKCGRVFNFKR